MRFATRMLIVQVATQIAVVAVCTAVFAWLGVQQLKAEADASALNIARSVAESPQVRALVADFSADPGTPDAVDLRGGVLQRYAGDVTARTEGLFVVITASGWPTPIPTGSARSSARASPTRWSGARG